MMNSQTLLLALFNMVKFEPLAIEMRENCIVFALQNIRCLICHELNKKLKNDLMFILYIKKVVFGVCWLFGVHF